MHYPLLLHHHNNNHHHHVPEGLGVFPVHWSSRWSWSLHHFLGRPMFVRPFGLYCGACFGSLSLSILCTCCLFYCPLPKKFKAAELIKKCTTYCRTNFRFPWPCIVSKLWSERENQQDATVTFTVLAPYKAAPHNRYQPHPPEPAQHTTCSNIRLVLLKMGIMMPETCWEIVKNKHLTVASCWFSLSLHNL